MKLKLCWIILVGATLPAGAAFPGYLPRVGPSPLRFILPSPVLAQASLPLLSVKPPEPVLQETNALSASSPAIVETVVPQPDPDPEPVPPMDTGNTDSANPSHDTPDPGTAISQVPSSPLVTPLSLLPYFVNTQNGTNSPTYMLPIGFYPPLPQNAPSSSATYESPPGPTPASISTKP